MPLDTKKDFSLDAKSWHARLYMYASDGESPLPRSMCPYFWNLVGMILTYPLWMVHAALENRMDIPSYPWYVRSVLILAYGFIATVAMVVCYTAAALIGFGVMGALGLEDIESMSIRSSVGALTILCAITVGYVGTKVWNGIGSVTGHPPTNPIKSIVRTSSNIASNAGSFWNMLMNNYCPGIDWRNSEDEFDSEDKTHSITIP